MALQKELLREAISMGMSLPEACKAARAIEGLSQQAFAELVGLSSRVIKDLERGKGNPRLDSLEKIADAVGLQVMFAKPAARVSMLDSKKHRESEAAARSQRLRQAGASARGAHKAHEANAVNFQGVSYSLPSISE